VSHTDATCPNCREIFPEPTKTKLNTMDQQYYEGIKTGTPTAQRPFDPHTDVSEDARYIARHVAAHLWAIFVGLPVAGLLLYAFVHVATR
jgi:hypothetical protein